MASDSDHDNDPMTVIRYEIVKNDNGDVTDVTVESKTLIVRRYAANPGTGTGKETKSNGK